MASLECASCAAPLTLPQDLNALEAVCTYCQHRTPLPADMVQLRMQQQMELDSQHHSAEVRQEVAQAGRRASSMATWITLISVILPLIITGIVIASTMSHIPRIVVPHTTVKHR